MSRADGVRAGSAPPAAGPSAARDLNTTRIVRVLRDHGPLTQAELVRRSGLARPTVTAIVRDLLGRRVVVDLGPDVGATRGRPGELLAYDPRCATVAAARVIRETVEVWVADSDGAELGRGQVHNPGDPPGCLGGLAGLLDELSAAHGVPRPSSVAMLLVGRVDPATGVCLAGALGQVPVSVREMSDRLAAPVTVLNPTAAAVLGVARAGRYSDALLIFLDRGIGAGVVSGSEVLLGATGVPGELGHCRVPDVPQVCRCGRRGCLEVLASGWSILERAAEILGSKQAVPPTLAGLEGLEHDEIDRLLSDAAWHLGLATSWLVNTLNPSAVLLGGTPFAAGADRFLATFARSVVENSLEINGQNLLVAFAEARADIHGATQAALDRLRPVGSY